MKSAMLHIKVQPSMASALKRMSKKRDLPVGELVRQAIERWYHLDLLDLPEKQRNAVSAYQEGYISLGKLSEEMGMTNHEVREWLNSREIRQNSAYADQDAEHA